MRCPFCREPMVKPTDDHIFPMYLGGSETVLACASCNSTFGHTFEARTSENLTPTAHVIARSGINLSRAPQTWKKAHQVDGRDYDFHISKSGAEARPIRRKTEKNEKGEVQGIEFQNRAQYEEFLKEFRRKHPDAKFEVTENNPRQEAFNSNIRSPLLIDVNLRQQALKVSIAAAVRFGVADQIDDAVRGVLFFTAVDWDRCLELGRIPPAYTDYAQLDAINPPLCHLVYLEENERAMYSIVRFFGAIQIYCLLRDGPLNCTPRAFAAILDPVTGEEKFTSISAFNLARPPDTIFADELPTILGTIVNRIYDSIRLRGGIHLLESRLAEGGTMS